MDFLVLADHAVLDVLNTVPMVDGELVDALQSDADVVRWLALVGMPVGDVRLKAGALLGSMRGLREVIRGLVERRMAGKRVDVAALNEFLAKGRSWVEVLPGLRVVRRWEQRSAEQVLAPL